MKRIFSLLFISLLFFHSSLKAAEKLGPVPDGGKLITEEGADKEIYIYNNMTLTGMENFYKNEFKDNAEISRQDVTDPKVISFNDWGNSKWHNITVADKGEEGVEITVIKDSWTWIIGTLVIRFAGVFIILTSLMIFLYISGAVFSIGKPKKKDAVL